MEWLFAILVLVVFTNRYVLGSALRILDKRTVESFGEDPLVWPTVAIVVPVYNEGAHILKTADSFQALDYPRDKLQVVFIDDRSTDDTYQHLQTIAQTYPWMKVIQNAKNVGKRIGIKNAVLVTHNHYDHMDVKTLALLAAKFNPRIIVPLGNDVVLKAADQSLANVKAHDWGDSIQLSDAGRVTVEPSLHWSARGVADRFMALWCNFVVQTPSGNIYACGDTGYDENSIFPAMKVKYGGFRLALLPIGAYEPRWFMKEQHMNPAEAVKVFQELGAEAAIGHHWGTFNLTNEGVERPREALAAALITADIEASRFGAFQPGQVWGS